MDKIKTMYEERNAAPAAETQGRQSDDRASISPPADATLTEKDLYCIARVLQGIIYSGNLFQYCDCCPHAVECHRMARQSCIVYFNRVRPKLQKATGVYLGPLLKEDLICGKVNLGTAVKPPTR